MPQSVFNGPSGALPPTNLSGYANGLNAQADAKINYNSTLLGDLLPYAYGKPGRLSSQTAFLAIPHMLQKVVPVLSIPSAQWPGTQVTQLYHAIDDGDLAFTINIDRFSTKFSEGPQLFDKVGALRAIDPFCNLATVNYLLAGIQLFSDIPTCSAWTQFIRDIGMYDSKVQHMRIHTPWQILRIIRDVFIPFGIPRGSDMQGGQTQGSNAPNIFPVDHVTSLLMDGKCINLINIWRKHNVSAGDDMILVLKKIIPNDYVLSRQSGSYNHQQFTDLRSDVRVDGMPEPIDLEGRRREGVWQLVPQVYKLSHEPDNPSEYDYRENGYWHICRALQMSSADPSHQFDNYNDATKYRRTGELMEVSFQPLFIEGLSNGSSKMVIRARDSYPRDKEELGIQSIIDPATGRYTSVSSRAGSSSLGMVAAGPSPAAWKTYLMSKQAKSKKRKLGIEGGQNSRNVVPRRISGPNSYEDYANVIGTEEMGTSMVPASSGPTTSGLGSSTSSVAQQQPTTSSSSAGVTQLQGALDSVASKTTGQTGLVSGSSKSTKTRSNGSKGGKAANTVNSAATATMGLSSSYIQNSGTQGGSGNTGVSGLVGSVRASLLSNTPPVSSELNKDSPPSS